EFVMAILRGGQERSPPIVSDLVDIGAGFQQNLDALQTILARREHHRRDPAAIRVASASKGEIRGGRVGGRNDVFFGAVTGLTLLALPRFFGLLSLLALSADPPAESPPLPKPARALVRSSPLLDGRRQVCAIPLGIESRGSLDVRAAADQQLHRFRMGLVSGPHQGSGSANLLLRID